MDDNPIKLVNDEPGRGGKPLRESHEELYGNLLEVNSALDNCGTVWGWVFIILALGLCLTVYMGWYKQVPGLEQVEFHWSAYVVILVGGFLLLGILAIAVEHRCYRHWRPNLIEAIRSAKITRHRLLTQVEGDKAVALVAKHLKADTAMDTELY
jgi:hypothetical protein